MFNDTIAAIATAPGAAGIGVVRVSGALAESFAVNLFKPHHSVATLRSHHLYYGEFISPQTGKTLDIVLVTLMRMPHSYTGENVLEIHAHGAPIVLEGILNAVLAAGARVAAPGEFTRRALLNGRLDALQAEAIGDLVNARTPLAAELAIKGIRGEITHKIEEIREDMARVLSQVEASLDFGEDDINLNVEAMLADLRSIAHEINTLIATYREGRLAFSGISCPLVGKTNVGKSSLLNALIGRKRVLVSPEAGTTRDFVEETIIHNGLEIHYIDTAGIRGGATSLEEEGIEFVWECLALADITVWVLDGSAPISDEDQLLAEKIADKDCIVVINKSDLPPAFSLYEVATIAPKREVISTSAKNGVGIQEIKNAIYRKSRQNGLLADIDAGAGLVITKARHKAALDGAAYFISQAIANLNAGAFAEILAQDIREALAGIASIANPTDSEEILDKIFANFCIGK